MYNLITVLFCSIPIAAIVFFVVSLVDYRKAKKENEQKPGTYTDEQVNSYRLRMVISSAIVATLVGIVVIFAVLMFSAVAFM